DAGEAAQVAAIEPRGGVGERQAALERPAVHQRIGKRAPENVAGARSVLDVDLDRALTHHLLALERDRAFLAQRDHGDARPHLRELDETAPDVRAVRDLGGEALGPDDHVAQAEQLAHAWSQ